MRKSKNEYYLDIAKTVSERSTCLRRQYGAIIVNNDEIISTGYNGNPRGMENCIDIGTCYRIEHKIPSGTQYEKCKSVHAEQNAIISAARKDMIGSTLFLVGIDSKTGKLLKKSEPCDICKRLIINSGIDKIISWGKNNDIIIKEVSDWLR